MVKYHLKKYTIIEHYIYNNIILNEEKLNSLLKYLSSNTATYANKILLKAKELLNSNQIPFGITENYDVFFQIPYLALQELHQMNVNFKNNKDSIFTKFLEICDKMYSKYFKNIYTTKERLDNIIDYYFRYYIVPQPLQDLLNNNKQLLNKFSLKSAIKNYCINQFEEYYKQYEIIDNNDEIINSPEEFTYIK